MTASSAGLQTTGQRPAGCVLLDQSRQPNRRCFGLGGRLRRLRAAYACPTKRATDEAMAHVRLRDKRFLTLSVQYGVLSMGDVPPVTWAALRGGLLFMGPLRRTRQ